MSNAHGDHHEHGTSTYWTRHHAEQVVLDIGGDVGALVLYTPPELHGREIEVSPIGDDTQRVHTAVLERSAAGRTMFAAVYPELRAGTYHIWGDEPPPGAASSQVQEVTIAPGMVAQVDWR